MGNFVTMDKLFSSNVLEFPNQKEQLFIKLYGSTMSAEEKSKSEEELLAADTNFAHYIKMSLGIVPR